MSAARERPAVSVVVPTYERPRRLRALLDSLARQTLRSDAFEVVVVDDGPSSGGRRATAVAPAGLALRVIASEGGRGPAAARNLGWRAATAPLVAFTDDDCEASPGWLEALLAAHRSAPEAIIQGRTGPIVGELGAFGPFGRTRIIDRPTIYFETCNIAYPRALLERLGGFDETFPEPAGEDADLGWRALAAGAERVFAQAAVVSHAVENAGLRGYLRDARRGPTSMPMMARHPGLRELALYRRHFWHRNHALALLALAGAAAAPLTLFALALGLPWLRTLIGRAGAAGGHTWQLPAHAAFDAVEIASCVRNAARARVLVV